MIPNVYSFFLPPTNIKEFKVIHSSIILPPTSFPTHTTTPHSYYKYLRHLHNHNSSLPLYLAYTLTALRSYNIIHISQSRIPIPGPAGACAGVRDGRTDGSVLLCFVCGERKKECNALMFLVDGGAASCLSIYSTIIKFTLLCFYARKAEYSRVDQGSSKY